METVLLNVINWSAQVALVIGATALVLAALRVTDPLLRLRTWHGVLFVSLLLPVLQQWTTVTQTAETLGPGVSTGRIEWEPWVIGIVAIGIAVRLIWLTAGLVKLHKMRTRSSAWLPEPVWYGDVSERVGTSAELAVSGDVESAVTFGIHRPAILVPHRLLGAPESHQRAVVTHELHHVARHDWAWVLGEEGIRTVLWWHPAIWFALGAAQMAREEIVDRRTIAATGNRESYLEALVAAAEPAPAAAVGFGPQFYRRRQLHTRIRRLLKENAMSTPKLVACAAVLALAVPATVVAAGTAFPLVSVEAAAVIQDPPPPPPPPPPAPPVVRSQRPDMPPPPPPPPPSKATKSAPVVKGEQREVPPPPPPPPPPPAMDARVPPPPPPPPPRVKAAELSEQGSRPVPPAPPAPPKPPKVVKSVPSERVEKVPAERAEKRPVQRVEKVPPPRVKKIAPPSEPKVPPPPPPAKVKKSGGESETKVPRPVVKKSGGEAVKKVPPPPAPKIIKA